MKNKIKYLAIILLTLSMFNGCLEPVNPDPITKPEPEVKNQSEIISNLFGEGLSATVKGNFTDTEWTGVSEKIKTALEEAFSTKGTVQAKVQFVRVFLYDDVQIIVEKNPQGYTKWKTSADGKTMYLAYSVLNNDLQGSVNAAVDKMRIPEAGYL